MSKMRKGRDSTAKVISINASEDTDWCILLAYANEESAAFILLKE